MTSSRETDSIPVGQSQQPRSPQAPAGAGCAEARAFDLRCDRLRWLLFVTGLGVAIWLVLRSRANNDQFRLLLAGWELYAHGELLPFGASVSGGGVVPGCLTAILTGLPLFAWADYRAVSAATLLMHVLAYAILDRTLRGTLTGKERLLFGVFYWLNPWQLVHATHLWNPNWVFLPSAIHFWSAFRQRQRPSFAASVLHVLAIGAAFQMHGSFLTLAVISALLLWRGLLRLHWAGVACGAAIVAASLLPWALAVAENRSLLPMHDGFLGRGLVFVYPTLKGIAAMLRFGSMHYSNLMVGFDFTDTLGAGADRVLAPIGFALTRVVLPLTVLLAVAAQLWLWRRARTQSVPAAEIVASPRESLHAFVRWGWVGTIVTCMLSPISIQAFHVFIAMHFAVLSVVLWLGELWEARNARWVPRWVAAYSALALLILAAIGLGAPMFRGDGRDAVGVVTKAPHPLTGALGMEARCRVRVDPVSGDHLDPWMYAWPGSTELEPRR